MLCGILFGILIPGGGASVAEACTAPVLQGFEAKAQSLAPDAEAAGLRLLSCPESERYEAYQWLAFLHAMTKPTQAFAAKLEGARPATKAKERQKPGHRNSNNINGPQAANDDALTGQIDAAYHGDYKAVKTRIDEGDPVATGEPAASLAVARALIRERRFGEGREYYEQLLRLRPDLSNAEVEYLYTFLWEGNYSVASRRFAAVVESSLPPAAAQAVQRGKALIDKQTSGQTPGAVKPLTLPPPVFGASAEAFGIKDQMLRGTSRIGYHGLFDLDWHHHLVRVSLFDHPTLNTDLLQVGKSYEKPEKFKANAHLGFLTSNRSHLIGNADMTVMLPAHLWLTAGANRQPLFEDLPLAKDSLSLLRDSGHGGLGLDQWGHLQASLRRDLNGPYYEHHELRIDRVVRRIEQSAQTLRLLAGAAYEFRTRPSADYAAYHKRFDWSAGVASSNQIGAAWLAGGRVEYTLSQLQPFGTTTVTNASGIEVRASLDTMLGDEWRFGGQIVYQGRESDQPGIPFEHRMAMLLGVGL